MGFACIIITHGRADDGGGTSGRSVPCSIEGAENLHWRRAEIVRPLRTRFDDGVKRFSKPLASICRLQPNA